MIRLSDGCPFCNIDAGRIWLNNEIGVVISDGFPVTKGHSLVIPRLHVADSGSLEAVDDDNVEIVEEGQ